MAKLYDLHMRERLAPPTAMKRAQTWLRDATRAEIIDYARNAAGRAKLDPSRLAAIEIDLASRRHVVRQRIGLRDAPDGSASPPVATGPAARAPGTAVENPIGSRPFEHPYYWGGFIYTGL